MRERDDRHLRLAEPIAGISTDQAATKFENATINIGWDTAIEALPTARALVCTTLNLIARFCPAISLSPETPLAREGLRLLGQIDPASAATSTIRPPSDADAAVVWLGGGKPPASTTTQASADGWIAYVSSRPDSLPVLAKGSNPLGALVAAGLVTAEVFKRLLPPKPKRGGVFDTTAFSLWTYRVEETQGPSLPEVIQVENDPLLAGVGAVGQAFLHALSHLHQLQGHITLIDNQNVDETNLNRYVLANASDAEARTRKVDLGARALETTGCRGLTEFRELQQVLADIANSVLPRPNTVVSALDNDEARYELQSFWPDVVLEGATGDTLLQIFRHRHEEGSACLRCIHPSAGVGAAYEEAMSRRTGLTVDRIRRAMQGEDPLVTQEDIEEADESVRAALAQHVGGDLCGALGELERFTRPDDSPPEPAVSFTSYLAGCLLAAEFTREVLGLEPGVASRFQLDPIVRLDPDPPWRESKRRDCYCVERSTTIERYRTFFP